MKNHNPASQLLIGELNEDDKICFKEQKSWIIDEQPELFLEGSRSSFIF